MSAALLHLSKGSSALSDDGETPASAGRAAARTAPILALAADDEHKLSTGFLQVELLLLAANIAAVPIVAREI